MSGVSTRRTTVWVAVCLLALLVALFVARRAGVDDSAKPSATDVGIPATEPTMRRPRSRPTPPPVPTAPTGTVRVTVTSTDGKPIAGARVELFRGPDHEAWTDNEAIDFRPSVTAPSPERVASTDSEGGAVLDARRPGRWFVAAEAPGFGRHATVGVATGDESADAPTIALAPGAVFAGAIVDEKGAPAAGVAVVLAPTWTVTSWPNDAACLRTTTGADGRYHFAAVAPGEYRIWYAPQPDLLLLADQVRVPAIDRYDVTLSAGATIEGSIGDVDGGAPVAGVEVLAVQDSVTYGVDTPIAVAAGESDATGHFALRTWRPRCPFDGIVVDDSRFAPQPVDGTGKRAEGDVEEGQHVVLDVQVRRAAGVTGTVLGPDGPIPGFRVRVKPEDYRELPWRDSYALETVTAPDGRFQFGRLPAGKATIYVYRPWWSGEAVASEDVVLEAGVELVHDVKLDVVRGRVARRVVDTSGAPVADVEVVQDEGPLRATARTGADGRFALDVQLFAGDAELTLRHDGYRTQTQSAKIADDDDWELRPIRDAFGAVRDADGLAVPGADVELLSGEVAQGAFIILWHGTTESLTRADGTFRIRNVQQEVEGLIAHRLTDGATSKFEGVADANDAAGTELRLPAKQHILGRVVEAGSDVPIADVLIHQHDAGIGEYDVVIGRTDADGRFAVDFGPGKDNALRFEHNGWIDRFLPSAEIGDDLRVELSPSLVLGGVVQFDDGTPVAGATVQATVDDGRPSGKDSTDATTDAAGRFLVRDIAPGKWRLVVYRDDHTIVPVRPTAVAGDRGLLVVARRAQPYQIDVVDEEGAPVAKADVAVQAESDVTAADSDTTDASGSATVAALPDTSLVVHVEHEGFAPAERRGVRAGDEPLRIVLHAKR